ncbi:MAG: M23 family metallopeptidase [Patescibacteria group bacterium]
MSACQTPEQTAEEADGVTTAEELAEEQLVVGEPIEGFRKSVNLKPFGIYITPQNSPVDPERFTGYHTGVDVEMNEADLSRDIWIYSVAQGVVVEAREADGYGGVVAIQHTIEGQAYVAIYGHLDVASLKVIPGQNVVAGTPMGLLGEGYTDETDGERKHLHFALIPGETVDLKGYVQSEAELSKWVDPLTIL